MIDAREFGVVPNADPTPGLRAAIQAARGDAVRLPAGRIELTEPIEVVDAPVHLVGGGPFATTLAGNLEVRRTEGYSGSMPILRDLRVEGDGTGVGILLDRIVQPRLDNVHVVGFEEGIRLTDTLDSTLTHVLVQGCCVPLSLLRAHDTQALGLRLTADIGGTCMVVENSHGCAVWGGAFQGAACEHALKIQHSECFSLQNVYLEFRNLGDLPALSDWLLQTYLNTCLEVANCRISVATLPVGHPNFVPRKHLRLHRCNQARVVGNRHSGDHEQGDVLLSVELSAGVLIMVDGSQMSASYGAGAMVHADSDSGVIWLGGAYAGGAALGQQVAIRTAKPAIDGTDFQTGT